MSATTRLWLFRVVGISTLSVIACLLIFGFLGKVNVNWLVPPVSKHFSWPDLPQFKSTPATTGQNGAEEVHFTVPTRQITPGELSHFRRDYTNAPGPESPTSTGQ